jgi:hypothetical protein
MFFTDGNIAIWFTVSIEDEPDPEQDVSVAGSRHSPRDSAFMMTVVDTGTGKVYGKVVDEGSLSGGSKVGLLQLQEWLLKDKKDVMVRVLNDEEDKGKYSVAVCLKAPDGNQGLRIVGPIDLGPSDAREGGLMGLFGNIAIDMQAMIKERDHEAAETFKRDRQYRELTRKINERGSKENSRLTELFAGFAVIINDKNRQLSKMSDTMDDLSRAKSSRALPFTMDEDKDPPAKNGGSYAIPAASQSQKKRGRPPKEDRDTASENKQSRKTSSSSSSSNSSSSSTSVSINRGSSSNGGNGYGVGFSQATSQVQRSILDSDSD